MFQLLQPIWLLALAGLSIPVVIHLWNQRPGKTMKVGSIALVRKNALPHTRKIRISDILLLLIRCLLLACMALALAGPVWKTAAGHSSRGWVLMPGTGLPATYKRFQPTIDSLLQAGFEFHYFEEGFKKENIEKALQLQADSNHTTASYRSLTALLNQQADSQLPLYVFTDNYLRNFGGPRTAAALNLHWFTYLPDTTHPKTIADTAALRATIFSNVYANDALYLQAALETIGQFSKKNIIVKSVTAVADIPAQQDWLFWLDDKMPVNAKAARHILLYAKGKPVKQVSYILPAGSKPFAAVDLYSSIIDTGTAASGAGIRWQDGFGHTLLLVQHKENSDWYYLFTHIDPAWNELPWSDNFPQLLYGLLYGDDVPDENSNSTGKTIIDLSQAVPVVSDAKEAGAKPTLFTETKLAGACWLLTLIFFFTERALSFHYYKTKGNE